MKKYILTLSFLFLSISIFAADIIIVPANQYQIDQNLHLIVVNQDVLLINSTWTDSKTGIFLDKNYIFQNPQGTVEIGNPYIIVDSLTNEEFTLYFTQLPLVSISTSEIIVDEPKVLASFQLVESDQTEVVSNIGIEYRGGYTQSLPKKSYGIEFWNDTTGDETENYSLLGMRSDDDWNFQAMFNEPLRFRKKTNHQLWQLIHTIYYKNDEPEAINGITMQYAELFVNGEYKGVFGVGEKVDRKQLKLKKHNGSIRGELYKGDSWGGAVTFEELPSYNNNSDYWGGFEYKHPDEEINWANLYDFVDFVINSDTDTFLNEYKDRFQDDNAVDYFIFLNLLRARDNTGKNLYIAKYNVDEPYFYVPWDLDGTFGINWFGGQENTTNDILSNGFYDRLILDCNTDGFHEKLKNRWNQLRTSVLTQNNIVSLFEENLNYLQDNGVYERENMAWNDYTMNPAQWTYMTNWMGNRLNYLDTKFNESCTVGIDDNDLASNWTIFPNPANTFITINNTSDRVVSIKVYGLTGQMILSKEIETSENRIDVSNLKNGVYLLDINGQQNSTISKLIISK